MLDPVPHTPTEPAGDSMAGVVQYLTSGLSRLLVERSSCVRKVLAKSLTVYASNDVTM